MKDSVSTHVLELVKRHVSIIVNGVVKLVVEAVVLKDVKMDVMDVHLVQDIAKIRLPRKRYVEIMDVR